MKYTYRIIGASLLIVFWLFSITFVTAQEYVYVNTSQTAITIVKYNGIRDNVVVPEFIDGRNVTSIGSGAFAGWNGQSITLPNSVTSIGDYAFINCSGLRSVRMGNGVGRIGNYAFSVCPNLVNIFFPGNAPTVGPDVFYGNYNVTVLYLEGATGWGVTFGGRPAIMLTSPSEVVVNWNDPQVITYGTPLSSVQLNATANVPGTFEYTPATGSLLTAGQAQTLTVTFTPNDTVKYKPVSASAHITVNKSLLTIKADNKAKVVGDPIPVLTASYDGFVNGETSDILDTPLKITTTVTDNSPAGTYPIHVFNAADSNYDIKFIDGTLVAADVAAAHDFTYVVNQSTITITKYIGTGGWVIIPKTIEGKSVTRIGDSAFFYCVTLTSVTLPDSVTSIGDYAFCYCPELTSIVLPNSVTTIGNYAFSSCYRLNSITLPNGVTSIGDFAFCYCFGLIGIQLPDSLDSMGSSVFYGCQNMKSVTVDALNENYSDAEGVLFSKDKSVLVYYPAGRWGNYEIPNSVIRIGDYAFSACQGLASVAVGKIVASIGVDAFNDCSRLMSISVNSLNEKYSDIDGVLFNKDKSQLIHFPRGRVGKLSRARQRDQYR